MEKERVYNQRKKFRRKRKNNTLRNLMIFAVAMGIIGVVFLYQGIYIDTSHETIEVFQEYNIPNPITFGIDASNLYQINGEVNTNTIGTYKVEYKFLGLSALGKKVKTIDVVDSQKPIITLNGSRNYCIQGDIDNYIDPGFTAIDNYDGNITEKVIQEIKSVSEKEYVVDYIVADSAGNMSFEQRRIYVETKGIIYLTFDDGPSVQNTAQILDLLKEYGIKATFFVVGYSEAEEDLVKREVEEGHTVGLHGYSHDYSKIYTSIENLMNNFYKLKEQIYDTTNGYEAKFIRFPGGSSNTVSKSYKEGIMSEAAERVLEEGFVYFDWNVDVDDAGKAKTSEKIYENFVKGLIPGKINVVLLHDSYGHQATCEALRDIIEYGISNGYDFKNLTDSTQPITHNINN